MAAPKRDPGTESAIPTMLLTGVFLVLLTGALRLGAGMLLPVAIAGLFALLLDPAVRGLRRFGLSSTLGAALVVFGTLGVVVTGATLLAGPAADLVESAPRTLGQVQARVRKLLRPLQETVRRVDQATEVVTQGGPPAVQIKSAGLLQRISGSTTTFVAASITVVFLTFFLLATLPAFRKKLAALIGTRAGARNMEEVLSEIEVQMSRYMLINTLTSLGVGLATWGFLALVGLPNALLWGTVAFLLNFIPYAGALVTTALIAAVALVSFDDTSRVFLVIGGCAAINLLEGNLVTPHLIGRHLPLNPVAIFLSLIYWGWVWGAVGALLAVPITVMLQVIFSRIERLKPVAVLLDS